VTDGEKPEKRRLMVYFWPEEYARHKAVSDHKRIALSRHAQETLDASNKKYIAKHKLEVAYDKTEAERPAKENPQQ